MKLKDARAITTEELYERRKQAIILHRKQLMTQTEIGAVVGVRRDVVGRWIKIRKKGGVKALKPKYKGSKLGEGRKLSPTQ